MKLFNSAISLAVAFAPLSVAQQCLNNNIKPVTTGKQCPCLTVDAKCTVTDTRPEYADVLGEKCSALNVEADANGNYPDVQVRYDYSMCNYNRFKIEMKPEAKFYDWTKVKGDKQKNVKDPRVPLGGYVLEPDSCHTYDETFYLSTQNRYNIATQLEGFALDSNGVAKDPSTDYCYAYVSKAINIKRGLCKMQTAATCTVGETGQDCQEFVNQNAGPCKVFTAKFEWEACNGEPRSMEVLSDASNVKIARKVNGKMTNDRINRVGDLGPAGSNNECQRFGPQYRTYNTCNDEGNVFFSINVQGTRPNGNYWYECQDFTFEKVEFNPVPLTSSPTAGPTKNPTSTPTRKPTSSPTARPTMNPTSTPTMKPTLNPTSTPTMKPTSTGKGKGKGGKGSYKGRNLDSGRTRRRRSRMI